MTFTRLFHSKFVVILTVLVALLGTTTVLLGGIYYKHWGGAFVMRLAEAVPLPAARLDGRSISLREYLRNAQSVEKYLASDEAKKLGVSRGLTKDDRKNVLERLLREAALDELAAARNMSVSEEQMRRALETFNVSATSTQEFERLLNANYGWTLADFKAHILKPALLTNMLSISYAVDHGNDPTALEKYLVERLRRPDVVRYIKF